jgi:hypothetical protein
MHVGSSDLSAAATEFRATLDALGLAQCRVARWLGVSPRSVRRWQHGDRHVPRGVGIVLRLLAAEMITIDQVEKVAVPNPIWTNDSAKKAPLLRAEPAPEEQPALAPRRAKTAALANSSLTVAERVLALAPGACRWPCGDLGHPDFHFCGSLIAKGSYCERHALQAYLAPRPSRGHGVRVTYGRHGRPPIPGAATGASRAPKVLFDRAGDLPGSAPC